MDNEKVLSYISDEKYEKLCQLAKKKRIKVSKYIEILIRDYK